MKINDRVKALHADTAKSQPDLIKRLDSIDQQLSNQQNHLVEPMKRWMDDKFSPLVEQERNRAQAKKDGEEKFGRRIGEWTEHRLSGSKAERERENCEIDVFEIRVFLQQDCRLEVKEMTIVIVQDVFLSV